MAGDMTPQRGVSFKATRPGQPLDGARLDRELDKIHLALKAIQDFMFTTLDGDGSLKGSTVSERNLTKTAFDRVAQAITARAEARLEAAEQADKTTQGLLTRARESASEAQKGASDANLALSQSLTLTKRAEEVLQLVSGDRGRAEKALVTVTATLNATETYANSARIAEDMAYRWAEKLDGPVFVPQGGDPQDDGFYSSRYWANFAQTSVELGSFWYLGPFAVPPTEGPGGVPLQPGMWYFDTSNQSTFIWNGVSWDAISGGGAGEVVSVFGRIGVVSAQESDYASFYALKTPTEAHINATGNVHSLQYAQLLDIPASFPPGVHNHSEAEIIDLDKYTQAEIDGFLGPLAGRVTTNEGAISALDTRYSAHEAARNNPHETRFDDLLGKPATYPPSPHTHTETEITDLDKYTQSEVNAQIATRLPLAGGTLSGPLILSRSPVEALEAATRAYVDTVLSAQEFHDPTNVGSWRIIGNTLECWGRVFTAGSGVASVVFPKVFLNRPVVTAVSEHPSGLVVAPHIWRDTVTTTGVDLATNNNSLTNPFPNIWMNWHAIGEWDGVS